MPFSHHIFRCCSFCRFRINLLLLALKFGFICSGLAFDVADAFVLSLLDELIYGFLWCYWLFYNIYNLSLIDGLMKKCSSFEIFLFFFYSCSEWLLKGKALMYFQQNILLLFFFVILSDFPSAAANKLFNQFFYLFFYFSQESCQNYIRILVQPSPDKLMVCGTNSFRPMCHVYVINSTFYTLETEKSGQAVCPYDPQHNSTAVFVGK